MNARSDIVLSGAMPGLAGDVYHAHEAMSASGAKKMLRSPMHYKLARDKPQEQSDAMRFGTAVHCGVLEPDRFAVDVICPPTSAPKKPTVAQRNAKKPSPETVEAIAYWQEFNANAIGKIVLSVDEYAAARRCIDAVSAHPAASALLDGAERELSLFWNDGRYKVPCKARLDARNHGGIIDLKTTIDASPDGFARQCANLLYHLQAAFYFSGAEHVLNATPEFFAFICVESEEPHAVACYTLPSNAILAGAYLANIALERYAAALAAGEWNGYPDTISRLDLPRWATAFRVEY